MQVFLLNKETAMKKGVKGRIDVPQLARMVAVRLFSAFLIAPG